MFRLLVPQRHVSLQDHEAGHALHPAAWQLSQKRALYKVRLINAGATAKAASGGQLHDLHLVMMNNCSQAMPANQSWMRLRRPRSE